MSTHPRRRPLSVALGICLVVVALTVATPAAWAGRIVEIPGGSPDDAIRPGPAGTDPDYPPEDSGYHSYPEIVAELAQIAIDHPTIVRVTSLGTSAEGRAIPLVKITDDPDLDEGEPEVLFDALHHAREHLTPEMALSIIHLLVDGYETADDARTKAIVDSRVIWVVPVLNPDGLSYDLGASGYRGWRKNRQSNGSGVQAGTDLNRNYAWHWGGPGSSGSPGSEIYHGTAPFSAPESAALADFIASRVVDGRQRIRTHITFHTSGEVILYPYAYTSDDLTPDMTSLDHRTYVAMAGDMAATNGFVAEQESDLYVHSGTAIDWSYATQRIFAFTFELYPSDDTNPTFQERFYPPDEIIGAQTSRNHEAVLYLLEHADCPYRAIGKESNYCGPYYDDLEIARGWAVDPTATDTATGGVWQRGDPQATHSSGPKQRGDAASGRRVLVTGRRSLGCPSCNDVDGGKTTVRSPTIVMPASGPATLRLRYFLGHSASATSGDGLRVAVIDGGVRTVVLSITAEPGLDRDAAWTAVSVDLSAWDGSSIEIQLEATDSGGPSLVEAGVDDVRITAH